MDAERKRSKGSFFKLFDWNGKSRKKLFVNNSDSQERSEQGKEDVESITNSRPHLTEMNDRRASATNYASSDCSYASSVASDDGYGTRAPGVVARLMGLDCLPTSNIDEPSSIPLLNSRSLKASQYERSIPHLWSEYNSTDYLNVHHKRCSYSLNSREARPRNVQSRPIERFRTEVLPPKSSKSIPITHHNLLSPIRSPGFVPRKNVAYIMEAASKLIDASPRATNSKVSSIASSSIPMRIRDLKQKMEAANTASGVQRSGTQGAVKNKQGQLSDKSCNGSEGMSSGKASMFSHKGTSDGVRRKGISTSPAPRSKAGEQRRDGSASRSSSSMRQKEKNESKSNVMSKRMPSSDRTIPKRTSERSTSYVLRQNNQKQNIIPDKDGSTPKQSVSNQHGKRAQSANVPSRTVNKIASKPEKGSRKMNFMTSGSGKEKPLNASQKKLSANNCFPFDSHGSASGIVSLNKDERAIRCNVAMDGFKDMSQNNMKNGMDVVSFTFSSPIKTKPNSQSSSSALELFGGNDYTCFKSSSSLQEVNAIGGDALGALLEHKLKELTEKVQSSNCNVIKEETSANASCSTLAPTLDILSTAPTAKERFQLSPGEDTSSHMDELDCFSKDSHGSMKLKWQQSEEMEEQSSISNYSEAGKELECLDPSLVSILDPLFKSGNCSIANGSEQFSLAQARKVYNAISNDESLEVDKETEASDSASSISAADVGRRPETETSTLTELKEFGDWGIIYLRGMLCNAQMMLKEFAMGQTSKVMDPGRFDWLENQGNELERNEEEYSKLARKLLFDCASECLDLMCGQVSFGGYKALARLWRLFQRDGWLAEKLYKKILSWKSMEDLMVDEIVEKEMSSQHGKWIEFSLESFEEGVEIGKEILTSLVDEIVSDLLLL